MVFKDNLAVPSASCLSRDQKRPVLVVNSMAASIGAKLGLSFVSIPIHEFPFSSCRRYEFALQPCLKLAPKPFYEREPGVVDRESILNKRACKG